MISYRDTDFDDGGFGGPPAPYYHDQPFFLNPYLLGGLVTAGVLLGIVMAVAYYLGRQRALRDMTAERETSVNAVYDSVKYMLEKALKAPGYAVLDRGRRVAEMLESRLGLVLALNDKPGKLIKEVEEALKGEKVRASAVPSPAKVKVALATDEHLARVWRALHEFNAFWTKDDGREVKDLIRAAQAELSTAPAPEPVKDRAPADSWWPFKRPAKVIEAALNDANNAGSAPIVVPPPVVDGAPPEPDPTPPPPPAPAPKRDKSKLPAHKRNMLA